MDIQKVRAKNGDSLLISGTDQGLIFCILSQVSSSVDVINISLNFVSLTRLRNAIQDGSPFVSNDGVTKVRISNGEITFDCELAVQPDVFYSSTFARAESEAIMSAIEGCLDGTTDHSVKGMTPRATPSSNKKLGGNELCHCGSGKKFKRCCIDRKQEGSQRGELEFVSDVSDERVLELAKHAAQSPAVLQDSDYWECLGTALGSTGYIRESEIALSKALEVDPGNDSAKENLAATWNALGRHDEALRLINEVPDSLSRVDVIKANILQEMGDHGGAINYYEKAIAAEPEFFLPYARILRSLREIKSPLFEHWLEKAVEAVPSAPWIALSYCRHQFETGRLEQLADATWIDTLIANVGATDMIGGSNDDPQTIVEAQLYKACGAAIRTGNPQDIEPVVDILEQKRGQVLTLFRMVRCPRGSIHLYATDRDVIEARLGTIGLKVDAGLRSHHQATSQAGLPAVMPDVDLHVFR